MKIKVKWRGLVYFWVGTYYVSGVGTLGVLVSPNTKQIISNVSLNELEVMDNDYIRGNE